MNTEKITQIKSQVSQAETSAKIVASQLDETNNTGLSLLNRMIGEAEEVLYQVEGNQRFKLVNLIESLSRIKSSVIQLQSLDFNQVAYKLGQLQQDLSQVELSPIE